MEPSAGKVVPDVLWYKDAIIYELHVKSFFDSTGDGIGDFPGLTQKLGYLQDLGINAVWVLPFYPSPLRDDGYDIADYFGVHPAYGSLSDFERFVEEAHQRGIRVITELVVNHTSDQHAWFQRPARRRRARRSGISTCGATPTANTPTRESSSSTSRSQTGPGTTKRRPTTGTGFSTINRT